MFVRSLRSRFVWFVWASVALSATPALAKDYFLTIGGGHSPTSNQVSLERNVVFFQQLLAEQRPDQPKHAIFFADGDRPERDLQFRDEQSECAPAVRILAELMGDTDELTLAYRDHQLSGVTGAARINPVRRQMGRWAREMNAGDRLFVYATAHGGSSNDDNPYNTVLYLWGDDEITVGDFTKLLDRLPEGVTIVLVMVQCHAGGFSHAIFERGDQELGLAPQVRCGFFSQEHDKAAAGCTPDVDEADYQEYSTFFWAAIAGRSRTGQSIPLVDYDGDGKTSLAEAHAYAAIESDTIDMPIRTSDALLRRYSGLGTYRSLRPKIEGESEPAPSGGLAGFMRALTRGPRSSSGTSEESYDDESLFEEGERQRDVIDTDTEWYEEARGKSTRFSRSKRSEPDHSESEHEPSQKETGESQTDDAQEDASQVADTGVPADEDHLDESIERDADRVAAALRGEDLETVEDAQDEDAQVAAEDDSDEDDSDKDETADKAANAETDEDETDEDETDESTLSPEEIDHKKVYAFTGRLDAIAQMASPVDRAIIERLSEKLKLSPSMTVEELRDRIREVRKQQRRIDRRLYQSAMRNEEVREELRLEVLKNWPELEGTYTPKLRSLLDHESDQLVTFVEGRSEYRIFKKTVARLEKGGEDSLRAIKDEAKLRRLYQAARRAILAANLTHLADPSVVEHYEKLIAAESGTLR